LDEYDELDSFQDITYKSAHQGPAIPSLNVSLLTKLCELSTITERILRELYSESQSMNQRQSQKISEDINSDLSKWRRNLPPQLDYLLHPSESVFLPQSSCLLYADQTPPKLSPLTLTSALSNVLIILSQRPLFTGHNHPRNSTTAYESVSICTTAANQIVQILRDYSQNFSIATAPYMLSYATYISATIHARIVAQKGRNSNSFQSLMLCRTVLRDQQCLYMAAGKAGEILIG
jgi:hypothetical protein